jgi:uncharacterized protein (TIGR02246 family)
MNRLLRLFSSLHPHHAVPPGGSGADDGVETAIRERLAVLESAWEKGDAKFAASEVYGADALIHGEGQKELVQTPAAVLAVLEHLMADSRSVRLDVHSLRVLGPEAAHTWVNWQVQPKADGPEPFDVRTLLVWSRGDEGWRIRADMYVMGHI